MNEETSKSRSMPINRFDMMAGAKATYEEFHARLRVTDFTPWEKLTQKQHQQWEQILKAGIRAAIAANREKRAKTSGSGSINSWWKFLGHYP